MPLSMTGGDLLDSADQMLDVMGEEPANCAKTEAVSLTEGGRLRRVYGYQLREASARQLEKTGGL
jgi:hypothetical protein